MATNQQLLAQFLNSLTTSKSSSTIKNYRLDLQKFVHFIGSKQVTELDPVDIQAYFNHLTKQKRGAATMQRHLSSLRQFYKYLIKQGLVSKSPLIEIQLAQPKTVNQRSALNKDQQVSLVRLVSDQFSWREMIIIRMLMEVGLKPQELLNLKWDDFDVNSHTLRIKSNQNERIIPISKDLVEMLVNDKRLSKYDIIITNKFGEQLSIDGLYYLIRQIEAVWEHPLTMSQLRETARQTSSQNHPSLAELQNQFGDRSSITTMRHLPITVQHLKEDYQRYFKR
ncbi:site-specific integrase [Limosilactobacillus gastricus]|uniref:tyrosine-type recombinase/integrase n=2 Tax=Limosilactobacillus gastricus TaxID=227942 RepID=UPI0002F46667|nr:site-specific integrase [Limosilactobacillus gastricus]